MMVGKEGGSYGGGKETVDPMVVGRDCGS